MIAVDNQFIKNRILSSVRLLEAIPSLGSLKREIAALEAKCETCSGNKEARKQLVEKYNSLRQLLVTLPEEKRKLIRTHLGENQRYRVSYRTGTGQNTKYVGEFI